MAPKKGGKKRVRIQSGHEARFIEKINSRRRRSNKSKRTLKSRIPRKSIQKAGSRPGSNRTHRPTVSELVYQFLERASDRGMMCKQKSSAPRQFRKLQRRKLSRKPDASPGKALGLKSSADEEERRSYEFPYESLPSEAGNKSIEKCIYEVLSLGTVLGLLVPVNKKGAVFRVSSDLELFKKKRDGNRAARKR
ncbi:uncharacterized protein LOC100680006 [Nasonia vitripennis]|uniref:Uncharacterized protein n=1 Tax=Nasonia vitripennis TaxID=7425 RepID=A0A7M7HAI2_NASVI|nr:uncharacterized protein LOC100680006 [Nasonia vitripennis]